MRHVRSLAGEPALLARYRAACPDEEHRPTSEATATWDAFRTDQSAYVELLDSLAAAQQGLCVYCEQRLVDDTGALIPNDYQVEHVQAKSGAKGRVLDWHNLALACTGGTYPHHEDRTRYQSGQNRSCGQTKASDDLPQGCDPRTFPLLDALVEVGMDGRLSVNAQHCVQAGVASKNIEDAIELLNLDCERLRKARQDRRDNVSLWLVPLLRVLLDGTHLGAEQRQQMFELLIEGRLRPDVFGCLRAFWSTERSALGPGAEAWISSKQVLFT